MRVFCERSNALIKDKRKEMVRTGIVGVNEELKVFWNLGAEAKDAFDFDRTMVDKESNALGEH